METTDVVVVGGGLAGLIAAAYAARGGAQVVLLERASELGGRARTAKNKGFAMNLGAHALYAGGAVQAALTGLGVAFTGGVPKAKGGLVVHGDALAPLPSGAASLMTSPLLSWGARLEAAHLLASLGARDLARDGETLAEWRARKIEHDDVWKLLRIFFRITGYANDPDKQSARTAIAQLCLATNGGVTYLDGGWGTLVLGLRDVAVCAGVRIRTGAHVQALARTGAGWRVAFARDAIAARAVVLATPPSVASALTGARFDVEPVTAACFDVGLACLPRPEQKLVLGLDRPLYFSVHTAFAKLAPEGASLVQLLKYHGPDAPPSADDEAELEAHLDRAQPGWRNHVLVRRFLPRMTVTHALVTPAGRPRAEVLPGVHLAGDWVGECGMLADAAAASARRAANACLELLATPTMKAHHGALV
jgi:phytoene dehydrogenase-like protein